MKPEIGKKYLITCNEWFFAPDNVSYQPPMRESDYEGKPVVARQRMTRIYNADV